MNSKSIKFSTSFIFSVFKFGLLLLILLFSQLHRPKPILFLVADAENNAKTHKKFTRFRKQPQERPKRIFECKRCNTHFTLKIDFIRHNRHEHINKERPFPCDACIRRFKDKLSLSQHQKVIHASDSPCECSICGRHFKQNRQLARHSKRAHPSERLFKCKYCKVQFIQSENMEQHLQSFHANELEASARSFRCNRCNKRFRNEISLDTHYKLLHLHDSEHTYDCNICGKQFVCELVLIYHQETAHASATEETSSLPNGVKTGEEGEGSKGVFPSEERMQMEREDFKEIGGRNENLGMTEANGGFIGKVEVMQVVKEETLEGGEEKELLECAKDKGKSTKDIIMVLDENCLMKKNIMEGEFRA